MDQSGESIRVVHPLFPTEGGGSTPTSPLHLQLGFIEMKVALRLNELWHSRLPSFTRPPEKCIAIGAEAAGVFYAVGIWSDPVARAYNGQGIYELCRLAIAPDAPKNTASRMLRVMRILVCRRKRGLVKLISYQDTGVHDGTIYRAAGWSVGGTKKHIRSGWLTRDRRPMQSSADKVRWEYQLRRTPSTNILKNDF